MQLPPMQPAFLLNMYYINFKSKVKKNVSCYGKNVKITNITQIFKLISVVLSVRGEQLSIKRKHRTPPIA